MGDLSLSSSIAAVAQLTEQCLQAMRGRSVPAFLLIKLLSLRVSLYEFSDGIGTFQTYLQIYEDDDARLQSHRDIGFALRRCVTALLFIRAKAMKSKLCEKQPGEIESNNELDASLKVLEGVGELLAFAAQKDQCSITLALNQLFDTLPENVLDLQASPKNIRALQSAACGPWGLRRAIETCSSLEGTLQIHDPTQLEFEQLKAFVTSLQSQDISLSQHPMLDWITQADYTTQQNDYIRQRQAGTGAWLLGTKQFKTWIAGEAQTLFCPGIPGAGKTIMTSLVVDHLLSRFKERRDVGVAYIYCDLRQKDTQDAMGLLATLLKQLVRSCPAQLSVIAQFFQEHGYGTTALSFDEIVNLLRRVSQSCAKTFIVVDALDECDDSEGQRSRFLKEIFDLRATSRANIFITSRLVPSITTQFAQFPRVEVCAQQGDVQKYVEARLKDLRPSLRSNMQLQEEIRTAISEAVGGLFLLARISLDSLAENFTVSGARQMLHQVSKQSHLQTSGRLKILGQVYDGTLERIKEQKDSQRELATKVLAWAVHANRPLTISELQHALAMDGAVSRSNFDFDNIPSAEDVVSLCAGLVTIDEQTRTIGLSHPTAQEYLKRTDTWFPTARKYILTTCLAYLSLGDFWSLDDLGVIKAKVWNHLEERYNAYPLLSYAASNWGHFVSVADTDQAVRFMAGAGRAVVCELVSENSMDGVHIAAYFGFDQVLEALIKRGWDPELRDGRGQTPLSWAAKRGNLKTVALLLKDSRVDPNSLDNDGFAPLTWAARYGHEHVAKLLLARADIRPDMGHETGHTPLLWASSQRCISIVIALLQILWDSGAIEHDRTPLHWAVANGHRWLIPSLLREIKIDWESRDAHGRTPLLLSATTGSVEMIEICLHQGADRAARDDRGRTAAHIAVISFWDNRDKFARVMDLLCHSEGELNVKDEDGKAPLSLAARMEDVESEWMVRELLKRGANPNTEDNNGRTPLSLALGSVLKVSMLVSSGASINAQDHHGRTPLMWAIIKGVKESPGRVQWRRLNAEVLLQYAMIDCKATDYGGRMSLSFAAEIGMDNIVEKMLDLGTPADLADKDGWTPLAWAAYMGHSIMVELLANRDDVDVNHQDKTGRTPISWAAERGHFEAVRLLLEAGADSTIRDDEGRLPLSWSWKGWDEDWDIRVVEQLLERDPDPVFVVLKSQYASSRLNQTSGMIAMAGRIV